MNILVFLIFFTLCEPKATFPIRNYTYAKLDEYRNLDHILNSYQVSDLQSLFDKLITEDISNSGVWQIRFALQVNSIVDDKERDLAVEKIKCFILEHENIANRTTILTIALGINFLGLRIKNE